MVNDRETSVDNGEENFQCEANVGVASGDVKNEALMIWIGWRMGWGNHIHMCVRL